VLRCGPGADGNGVFGDLWKFNFTGKKWACVTIVLFRASEDT
jgi:Tfp pilus tip-associated adhesin PilY1